MAGGDALPIKGGVVVSGDAIETVNARDLHAFLENGDLFANWISDRVAQYEFNENVDFVIVWNPPNNAKAGRPAKDYALTIDMAKELAMVERNAKGKEARQYFIKCERELKAKITTAPGLEPRDPPLVPLKSQRQAVAGLGDSERIQVPRSRAASSPKWTARGRWRG